MQVNPRKIISPKIILIITKDHKRNEGILCFEIAMRKCFSAECYSSEIGSNSIKLEICGMQ